MFRLYFRAKEGILVKRESR